MADYILSKTGAAIDAALNNANLTLELLDLEDYETLPIVTLCTGKVIFTSTGYASSSSNYNLMSVQCSAGDTIKLSNISADSGVAIISMCREDYTGASNSYVSPVVTSTSSGIGSYTWTAPYDCHIVVCYGASYTPVVKRFHNKYVTKAVKSEQMMFSNKKIVCFGDSITEFPGSRYDGFRYSDWISMTSGAETVNVGVGGTQLRQRTTPLLTPTSSNTGYAGLDIINMVKAACNVDFDGTHTYRDVVTNAAIWLRDNASDDNTAAVTRLLGIDWDTVDAVTVLGGTNDWNNAPSSHGTTGSSDVNTTLGAVNEIIRLISQTYSHVRIYWFTTPPRFVTPSGTSVLDARVLSNWSDVYANSAGMTLKQAVASVMNEVQLNHIPVCDLYNSLGINMYNFAEYFDERDNTHPFKGFATIARHIVGFIASNRHFN